MRGRRAVTLWVVGWVVVAVAGATLTWAVISRAGTGVSSGLEALPDPSATASTPGEPVNGSTLSASPSAGGTAGSGSTDGTDGTGGTAPEAAVSRTWQGVPGVVSVSCRGTVISRDSAFAYSGYELEEDDVGPDRVRVEFEDDDGRTRVEAACVDGVPVFSDDRSGEG